MSKGHSSSRGSRIFTTEKVEEWLREAGAPNPERRITSEIASFLTSRYPTVGFRQREPLRRTPFDREGDAIRELARVLPITEEFLTNLAQKTPGLDYEASPVAKARRALISAVQEMKPFLIRNPRPTKEWHSIACQLFSYYKMATGTCTISKEGPAARFLEVALESLGLARSPIAIEKAIARASNKSIMQDLSEDEALRLMPSPSTRTAKKRRARKEGDDG